MVSLLTSSVLVTIILGGIVTGVALVFFSTNDEGVTITIANIPLYILSIILSGIFNFSLSTFLVLVVIKYLGLRNETLVGFIPNILGYLAFSIYVFSNIKYTIIDYAYPYISLLTLAGTSIYGHRLSVSLGSVATVTNYVELQIPYLILSITIWSVVLIIIDVLMLRKIYLRQLEEGRLI